MSRRSSNSRTVRSSKKQQKQRRTTRSLRAELLEPRAMMSASNPMEMVGAYPGGYGQTVVSQTTNLGDIADTTVQNGRSAYQNFGRNGTLVATKSGTSESQAFMRFDMRSLAPDFTSAVLTLTCLQSYTTNQAATLRIRLAADGADWWTEGNNRTNYWRSGQMTWNNRIYGTGATVTVAASQWSPGNTLSVDVTSLVKQWYNTNRVATFVVDVVPAWGSRSSITFASREHGVAAYRPSLAVTKTTIINDPPIVVTEAAAAETTVTGTSTVLSVLGDDDLTESDLRYTWTATTLPSGAAAPTFSANGSNAAKDTTVTFHKAGTYVLTARISDSSNASVTTSVTVMVEQTFSSVLVTPGSATLYLETEKQFAASARDQFGDAMAGSYVFDWSASDGSITSDGLLTAPATPGSLVVTASVGAIQGTANVTVTDVKFLNLNDAELAFFTESLYADSFINRREMIEILRSVGADDNVVDAWEFADLKTILGHSATLKIPGYVQVLASNVVNGNLANAYFQGTPLGNLGAGSSATQLNHLVDKWFLGADHPTDAGLNYVSACGSLFVGGPSHWDMRQGALGDCYFIAALGSIADNSPAAIHNMFVYNGDNTWTVRFYVNGTADYVTVDRMLPVNYSSRFVFSNYGGYAYSASNELWIALAEKAYAQWNETGNEGRDGQNSYYSIAGGWMSTVYSQVLGKWAGSYSTYYNSNSTVLANAMRNRWAVTIGTRSSGAMRFGLYGNHAYDVVAYNRSTGRYLLYNPWGSNQPTKALTWNELKSVCDWFCVANPNGTAPISLTRAAPAGPAWAVDELYLDRGVTPGMGTGLGSAATHDENALAVNLLLQHVS